MAISVVMPALEMAQETGKLVSWLKKEGDRVSKGELLLEVETDKAVMEIESPGDGVLASISAQPGTEIPVGKTIAWIVQPGEAAPTEAAQVVTGRHVTTDVAPKTPAALPVATGHSGEIRISPKARRLAHEQGIDLSKIHGTGPGGEILAADIAAAASSAPATNGSTTVSAVAKLMAKRTTQAWTTVPHFFLVRDVDATRLNAVRAQFAPVFENAHHTRLTVTDLLIAIISRTLVKHPQLNASWIDGSIRNNSHINISIAMAIEGGVVAPVIHNANRFDLGEIAKHRHDLAERAKAGKLRPADIADGSFTISNLGMFDVDAFTAIITPPQVAILAVGRIAERVVAIDGKPEVRPMMTVTLSSDHRVVDGAGAALFMRDAVQALEHPQDALTDVLKKVS